MSVAAFAMTSPSILGSRPDPNGARPSPSVESARRRRRRYGTPFHTDFARKYASLANSECSGFIAPRSRA